MFEVKIHTREEFYLVYSEWCKAHNFNPMPYVWMPEKAFVCYKDETPTHVTWLWETDSAMCLIGFPASNKFASSELKEGGLKYLFKEMCKYAKEKHYVTVCTYSHPLRPTIVEALKENGFVVGDTEVINLIKNL